MAALAEEADAEVDVLSLPRSFAPDDEPPAHETESADDEAEAEKPRRISDEPVKDLSALRALLGQEEKDDTETE